MGQGSKKLAYYAWCKIVTNSNWKFFYHCKINVYLEQCHDTNEKSAF